MSIEPAVETTTPDDYFNMYPNEILIALEGSYQSTSRNFDETNDQHIAEIVSNNDATRIYLPGIAYIDDGRITGMKQQSASKSVTSQQLDSLSPTKMSRNQLSHLKLESLPKGFTVLASSDPRVHILETVTAKQNIPARIGAYHPT